MLAQYDYAQLADLCLARNLREIEAVCRRTLAAFNVEYFRYGWQHAQTLSRSAQTVTIMSCPSAWVAHYQEMGFATIDPKREYVRHNFITAVWMPESNKHAASSDERQFWADSADFALGYGATIPIPSKFGDRAALCVAFSPVQAERDHALHCIPSIESFAFRLQERVERLTIQQDMLLVNLTRRETEVLQWAAAGKTAYETGRILAISETTVLFHLNNAKRKLGVINKHQLVARALSMGVI